MDSLEIFWANRKSVASPAHADTLNALANTDKACKCSCQLSGVMVCKVILA